VSTPTSPPPTIAVVAVHGVADQKPGESARAIARMLLGVRRGLQAHFTSFRELGLSLPNRRVEVAPPSSESGKRSDMRPRFIQASQGTVVDNPDYHFMQEQLSDYQQGRGDDVYQTVRLEGARLADEGGRGEASVHIYEAYWADLSRVSDRLYRIIGEFYQLILHLPFLGLHAIDLREHARDNEHMTWWRFHRRMYGICLWILTVPLPILNILLFALGISIIPEKIHEGSHAIVALGLVGTGALIASGFYCFKRRVLKSPWLWLLNALIATAAMFVTARVTGLWPSHQGRSLYPLFGFLTWLAGGALLFPFFRGYDRHRPGICSWAIAFYLVITDAFAFALDAEGNSVQGLQQAMLRTLELTFSLLWALWLVLVVCSAAHVLIGWLTRFWWRRKGFHAGSPSARALFTGMLALTLSMSIFSQVTILLWALLLRTLGPILVDENEPFRPRIFKASQDVTVKQFLEGLLSFNGSPIFVGGMILTAIVAVMAIWAMWPSIWTELRPVPPSTDAHSATRAKRQGYWLTAGFRLMRLAGELVGFGVLVAIGVALDTLWRRHTGQAPPWSGVLSLTPTKLFGFGAVTGTVAGLFALGRVTDELALGFRPALDVLLDVDNCLRSHPNDRTPRARISERYATLLRYLCRWENRSTDSTPSRYAAIVIIAHSQGTVITADLLRFLRRERGKHPAFEVDLDRLLGDSSADGHLPVYFFTMGCPLRQLYRLRFPDLYSWVDVEAGMGPDPDQLGVRRWVNVYRSGDYVGRNLWTPDSDEDHLYVPEARPRMIDPVRSESCIGAGAHTHYWDDTAPMVANELDRLIADAIAGAAARPRP
jgi:hypothetical protein